MYSNGGVALPLPQGPRVVPLVHVLLGHLLSLDPLSYHGPSLHYSSLVCGSSILLDKSDRKEQYFPSQDDTHTHREVLHFPTMGSQDDTNGLHVVEAHEPSPLGYLGH